MSEISRHPVVAATRALRFADHVTKRNEGSGNENAAILAVKYAHARFSCPKFLAMQLVPFTISNWLPIVATQFSVRWVAKYPSKRV